MRTVDGHPMASTVALILERIGVSQHGADDDSDAAVVVGYDGAFRAGMLVGRPDLEHAPRAHLIGAHRRREAALRRAAQLDATADGIETLARNDDKSAASEEQRSAELSRLTSALPSTGRLLTAEANRAAVANQLGDAMDEAAESARAASLARQEARTAEDAWSAQVTASELPPLVDELRSICERCTSSALGLAAAGRRLAALRPRVSALSEVDVTYDHEIDALVTAANRARSEADQVVARHDEIVARAGDSIEAVMRRHAKLVKKRKSLEGADDSIAKSVVTTAQRHAEATTHTENIAARLREAEPKADAAVAELRTLLGIPGVVAAVGIVELPTEVSALLEAVSKNVGDQPGTSLRTVRERSDEARSELVGTWTITPGDDHRHLTTYVLSHRDVAYTPLAAAAHASELAEKAQKALQRSEDEALREFVMGRLPSAIGEGWTRLHDWVREVNQRMTGASASSGVGVRIRVALRDDLSPAAATVHELACKSGEALVNDLARIEVGTALRSLISAAEGENMIDRVADAVNIRDWVRVSYMVERPGQDPKRWTDRTGLSGGERRLVVLAPMIAALAATYDRFGDEALRLLALDEVPSEVDEAGKEGLARYIAQLGLDLIATSHGWDGAPGAWDGIDAYDLEVGSDGTVVEFPMAIRSIGLLPGDDLLGLDDAAEPVS